MPRNDSWLAAFHAGERWALEECYREQFARVAAAARSVVGPVDAETIIHEVFCRLLDNASMRASFRGGSLGAWLTQVVVRSAIDDIRRRQREVAVEEAELIANDEDVEAKLTIAAFRAGPLPPELDAVFDARFLRQLSQRDAARELGIPRSTLVYQEQKVRDLLHGFLLDGDST